MTAADGDVEVLLREQVAEALYREDEASEYTEWPDLHNRHQRNWLRAADAVLALPALADLLALRERVAALADEYASIAGRSDLADWHRFTCRTAADRIRTALNPEAGR